MRRILLHPLCFLLTAALLFTYAVAFGRLSALLGVLCLLYLAWHFCRQATRQSHALRASRGQPLARIRRLIYLSCAVGLALGGFQGYWQFLRLGWDSVSALAASAGVITFSGGVTWLVLRAVWGPKKTAGA
jgi:threonine/homoserine/homoserine lactone efflux protein